MEQSAQQALAKANAVEERFAHTLTDSDSDLNQAVAVLQQYRAAAEHVVACDFSYARANHVEWRLWNAHNRLHGRLRKHLTKLRKERSSSSSSKPVESRKLTKLYLEFLKDSQRFYRDHIQKLNFRFGGIPDLERIARQVRSDSAHKPSQTAVSPQIQQHVVLSCHQTLIYLGDLFRYRAAERLDKEPDWGPAIGYYGLAASLRPCSGLAYHQQSVIAFEQGDYLRSTYYLYRSINVPEPHPNAIPNLELQFKKISSGWQKGDLVPKTSPQDPNSPRKALVSWFIRFHSLCYNGQHFPEYQELEREILSRTTLELKSRTLDGVLLKMTLINFSAQATAGMQFESKPDQQKFMQSYFFFLRFNIKFFTVALETYFVDLDDHVQGQDGEQSLASKITNLARHVLPGLRLYSTWLLSNAHIVAARVGDESLQRAIDHFWLAYAKSMSLVASSFSFRELSEIPYQLEEDVDAFGLKPLESDRTRKLWLDESTGIVKPKFNDDGIQRLDSNQEMLARIRELLFDALLLAVDENIPITFDGSRFVHENHSIAGLVPPVMIEVDPPHQKLDNAPAAPQEEPNTQKAPTLKPQVSAPKSNSTRTINREAQLSRMVDDLVGADEDDENVSPSIPPAQSFEPTPVPIAEIGSFPANGYRGGASLRGTSPRNIQAVKTPELRSGEAWQLPLSPTSVAPQRLHSLSGLWGEGLPQNSSPLAPFPNVQTGMSRKPSSGSATRTNAHSRVNSTTSVRSSLPHPDSLSSFEPTPNAYTTMAARQDRFQSFQGPGVPPGQYTGMHSPLLFGAGVSPWSTGPRRSLPNLTPPNGQVGQGG